MKDHIFKHWEQRADDFKDSHCVSWGDIYCINLEIETISKHIEKDHNILEGGCGNGFSSFHYIEKGVRSFTGIDISKKMIDLANNKKREHKNKNSEFLCSDIRELSFKENSFDIVYTTRTLINLPTWEEQKQAITECIRVCKKGGKILFSETFWEPFILLNSLRTITNIKPLQENDYNKFIKKAKLDEFLNIQNIPFEVIDFSGVYYFGTRFFRDLLTPEEQGYKNKINELFYNLQKEYSANHLGMQQAYVLIKP